MVRSAPIPVAPDRSAPFSEADIRVSGLDDDVIVPPRSSAVPSDTAGTAPMRGDRHLRLIAERGRMGWQRASGYNWRALVEADVPR